MDAAIATTKRTALTFLATLMLLVSALAYAQPAEAATWKFVRKSTGNGCIEMQTNGHFYRLTSVCNSRNNKSAVFTTYYLSGERITMCIPKGTYVTLGIKSEFHWASNDSGVEGCALDGDRDGKRDPYRIY